MGHRTALSTVEEFGLIDALYPGRLDLGLGRSGGRPRRRARRRAGSAREHHAAERPADPAAVLPRRTCWARRASRCSGPCCSCPAPSRRTTPSRSTTSWPCWAAPTGRPRASRRTSFPARAPRCRSGSWAAAAARAPRWPGPTGCGSRPTTTSARPPCSRPSRATGPRSGRPADLDRPYVSVSADVVVAEDEAAARELAAGYGPWVRSIRSGEGAIQFPTPAQARAARLDRRRPGPGRRPGRHPVRRHARPGRRPARAAPRSDRRRRADHHHHHSRPRRPGPLRPAPGPGMGPARLPVTQLVPAAHPDQAVQHGPGADPQAVVLVFAGHPRAQARGSRAAVPIESSRSTYMSS